MIFARVLLRGLRMKDAYEILRLKENELRKVEEEVEALRIVAPLLSDDEDVSGDKASVLTRWTAPTRPLQVPRAANANPQPEHAPEWRDKTVGFP
jgi:hypothetical protein